MRSAPLRTHEVNAPCSPDLTGLVDDTAPGGILEGRPACRGCQQLAEGSSLMTATSQLTVDMRPDRSLLPGVVVSVSAHGPKARVDGTRLDVFHLLDALVELGDANEVAEDLGTPVEVVWAAVAYGQEFPARVDAERAADTRAGQDVEHRYHKAG